MAMPAFARRSNWSISHSCRRAPSCKPAEGACGGLMRQTDRRAERRSPDCCVDSAAHAVCGQCYRIKDASPFANSLLTHVPFAFHIRLVTCSSQILFEVLKIPRCPKNVTLRFLFSLNVVDIGSGVCLISCILCLSCLVGNSSISPVHVCACIVF